jgi:hypothetical protein
MREGALDLIPPEGLIDGDILSRHDAKGNLGFRIEEGLALKSSPAVEEANEGPGLRILHRQDIAPENPGVAPAKAF